MKLLILTLISLFLVISSIRSEYELTKAWQSICLINSCEATLQECINHSCFGKTNCKSCVEDYKPTCSKCVDDIFDVTAQIQLPGNINTIICDKNSQLHTTVCNFYCRGLFKPVSECEILNDFPVCNCVDSFTTTTTAPTTTTAAPTTTTTSATTKITTTTTTTPSTTAQVFGKYKYLTLIFN